MSRSPKYTTATLSATREAERAAEEARRRAARDAAREAARRQAEEEARRQRHNAELTLARADLADLRSHAERLRLDAEALGGDQLDLGNIDALIDDAEQAVEGERLSNARTTTKRAAEALTEAEEALDRRLEELDRAALVTREMITGLAAHGFAVRATVRHENGLAVAAHRDDGMNLTAFVLPHGPATELVYHCEGRGFDERVVNGRVEARCDDVATTLTALQDDLAQRGIANDGLHWDDKPLDTERAAQALPTSQTRRASA
jgi:hypothetical protein